jgi:hypothetical protein
MSSFQVPHNVPSFNDPQRRYEDAVWGNSGRSRFGNSASNGFGLHLPGTDSKELPMYKDKPYNYPHSQRRGRKRLYLGLAALLVVFWLYYKGWVPGSSDSGLGDGEGKGLWGTFSSDSRNGPANWTQRREQVKKAMEISWSAYEKYAWGMSSQTRNVPGAS